MAEGKEKNRESMREVNMAARTKVASEANRKKDSRQQCGRAAKLKA